MNEYPGTIGPTLSGAMVTWVSLQGVRFVGCMHSQFQHSREAKETSESGCSHGSGTNDTLHLDWCALRSAGRLSQWSSISSCSEIRDDVLIVMLSKRGLSGVVAGGLLARHGLAAENRPALWWHGMWHVHSNSGANAEYPSTGGLYPVHTSDLIVFWVCLSLTRRMFKMHLAFSTLNHLCLVYGLP